MDERDRRRGKRFHIELYLEVDHSFRQKGLDFKSDQVMFYVQDISKSGIGFVSDVHMPVDYYFRGIIRFDGTDSYPVVIQIVRCVPDGENNRYGAEFVALEPLLAAKIEEYEEMALEE